MGRSDVKVSRSLVLLQEIQELFGSSCNQSWWLGVKNKTVVDDSSGSGGVSGQEDTPEAGDASAVGEGLLDGLLED